MVKILIVDDHPLVANSLASIIATSKIGEVTGIVGTAKDCLNSLATKDINLVLLDINLPDGSGIDICKLIISKYPQVKVLSITSFS